MQDSVINEDKDSSESFDCCIPCCCDKVEVLNIEYEILSALKKMVTEREYCLYYEVHRETLSNLEICVKEALEKLKDYQKKSCTIKQ